MKISLSLNFNFVLSRKQSSVYHHALGGNMPRNDLVERARAALAAQKESREVAERAKLHDAEVIKTDGAKKWVALKKEINAIVAEINGTHGQTIEVRDPIGYQIQVINRASSGAVTVNFDADKAFIQCSGSGVAGSFPSTVKGNELVFTGPSRDGRHQQSASEYSIEEIADRIVASAVGINP
jgi:hypothetical protein